MKSVHRIQVTAIVDVAIDDAVFERALDPAWQADFYKFADRDEVAENLAYNAIANTVSKLSQLDGFADMDDGLVDFPTRYQAAWEVEAVLA